MADGPAPEKIDPVLYMLIGGMVFFTVILFASEIWFSSDSQLFQVVAGVLTGFTGAFFGRLKPSESQRQIHSITSDNDAGKTTMTETREKV